MKKIVIILSVIALAALAIYFYTYKSHRDISSEKANYSLTLLQLQNEFRTNDSLFNAKYADKTIEIYGKITAVDLANNSFMLDEKIAVSFLNTNPPSFRIADSVYVKGRYVGYDDLLEEFKVDQATIVNK